MRTRLKVYACIALFGLFIMCCSLIIADIPHGEGSALWTMAINSSDNNTRYSTTYNEARVPESFGVGIFPSPVMDTKKNVTGTRKIASGDSYQDYLYVSNQMKTGNDFLIFCLLDYQQIPFELENSSASVHQTIHLEPYQESFYRFKIPPMKEGFHDFEIFLVMKPGEHSLNNAFRLSTDNAYLGSERVNILVGDEDISPGTQCRLYDGPTLSCGRDYVLNDGMLVTEKPCDNKALLSSNVTPSEMYDYSVNIAADSNYPVSLAIVPLLDYYQVPLMNNSDDKVAFFNLGTGQKMAIPVNVRVPHDEGIHELMVLWIPRPCQPVDKDAGSTEHYHQWPDPEPSVRVGLNVKKAGLTSFSGCTDTIQIFGNSSVGETAVVPQHTFISPPSHTSDFYRISVSGFFPRKDTVSISNNGSIPVSLYGWKLIAEPSNLKFILPGFSISPEKSVMVYLNKSGTNTGDELFFRDGALTGNISSIGLYDDRGNRIVYIGRDDPVPELSLLTEQNVSSPVTSPPENKTAVAIGIALNDSSVRTHLTGPWTITDVSLNAGVTFAHDGREESFRTPVVIFDTESRVVDVYVDMENRSVVYISESPKRVPMHS
jgi:hypothetical protein